MNSPHPTRTEKIKHEFQEILWLFVYLSFFFCALVAYDMLLLNRHAIEFWNLGFALLNAAVVTKVILIGEYAKVGTRHEHRGLLISTLWKALVFSLLVFGFHLVEEVVKRLIHGADIATAAQNLRFEQFGAHAIVVLVTFIPLFAFREFRRVMGEQEFNRLVFRPDK